MLAMHVTYVSLTLLPRRGSADVRLLMDSVNSTVRRVLERELVTAPPLDTRPVQTQPDTAFVGEKTA